MINLLKYLAFHRLHSQDKYAGTGIGLALCKKIVANHQGEISAISKENEGALFTVIAFDEVAIETYGSIITFIAFSLEAFPKT